MPVPSAKIVKYLLVFTLALCLNKGSAQVKYDDLTFRIDSLASVGLPNSALKLVDQLDDMAHKDNNTPQQVRAAIYRMTFQSYLEESALTAIIIRLRADVDKAEYPVKPVLQSLLAQMYWSSYQQNRGQYSQRSRLDKPDPDFNNWDLQTIITQTGNLYEASLSDALREQNTPVGVLDGMLNGDKDNRYLRPTLYDLLVQRAFEFFLADEAGITKPKLPFTLNDPRFFGDSRAFANLKVNTTDTASVYYKGIKYLQQATLFHLKGKDEEALADLDLQRLKFLYDKANLDHKDSLYLAALHQIAMSFSTKPISTEALVLQGQYYKGIDSLAMAYALFKKAAETYPQSLGGKNAQRLIREIEAKSLSASVESVNVPGRPLLGLVKYKNAKQADVFIYRLSPAQVGQLMDKDAWAEGYNVGATQKTFKFLKGLVPVQIQRLVLPDQADYREHSAEFKINPLEAGNYVILVKDANSDKGYLKTLTSFSVTHLAYTARVNPNQQTEVRVTDRETGAPLQGVNVGVYKDVEHGNKTVKTLISSGISDVSGRYVFTATGDEYVVKLSKGTDIYTDNQKYFNGAIEPATNNTVETRTILFTDRQIYRPGQTIYFKALKISTVEGKSTALPQTAITVNFLDINYKNISSVRLVTNEFGSVQGLFVIPQNIGGGTLSLTTVYGSISVQVEEYKRPTFQVTFEPVTQTYKVNDSVKVKGKVTAFSGYGLSQAKVAVHVTRQTRQIYFRGDFSRNKRADRPDDDGEIETDTLLTDDKGGFELNFKATADQSVAKNDAFNYSVNADATDESGETQSAATTVIASNNPLKIDADLPQRLLLTDTALIPLKLTNLYDNPQKGTVDVKIYALKSPQQVFKARLWDSPDQFILKRETFKESFPDYAWKKEDNMDYWPVAGTVSEVHIKIADTSSAMIDLNILKKQLSGTYKIVMATQTDKGDTTSVTTYINVIADHAKAQKMDDWVNPLVTQVKPGQQAEFLLGTGKPVNVLMEKYDGARLLSSEWLKLPDGDQQHIKITVPESKLNSFAVQFLMVSGNRVYHYYTPVKVMNPDKNLKIRFITFRDKLQPGEKEQWKLEVTAPSNQKPSAEMLADLYDASLDDITAPQQWQTGFDSTPDNSNYFEWMDDELAEESTTRTYIGRVINDFLFDRNYEYLSMTNNFDMLTDNQAYQYYLEQVASYKVAQKVDKKIAAKYLQNAALVKNGYDVNGRVVSANGSDILSGTKISIKNTGISTLANSAGYFKIKVPLGAILIFSYPDYVTKQIAATKVGRLLVTLKFNDDMPYLDEADPGVKSLRGVKNADVKMDESFGLSDAKVAVAQVKFPPPMVKGDKEAKQYNAGYMAGAKGNTMKKMSREEELEVKPNPAHQSIPLRANFNETAFFYPQLRTNEKGEILIDFTIPEALTRWKFRGFAHTPDLQTGYIENTIVTQKQLSISANAPRFLREGDTITISARLVNLTGGLLKGKVQLQLFNALNMQPVMLFADKADGEQLFEIAGGTTKPVSFCLMIPAGLDALTYRLTADAGQFTDGEENTLPVLPNRTLVTESMPMVVRAGQSRSFTFDKLVNQSSTTLKNKTLTLEYTQNPAWYAVQALPYMMEFPYECAEQVFSRYYANSLATTIINKTPAIKRVFDQWKTGNSGELLSNLEKNQELKATLIEETPWLNDALGETEQKKRIALLFDLNKMSDELKLNLDKLQKKQLGNGGFGWFGGNEADRFITQHIAEGMGELHHLGIADNQFYGITAKTLQYLDDQLVADEKSRKENKQPKQYGDLEIHAWFTRSYFLDRPVTADLQKMLNGYLAWAQDAWTTRNVYEQAMIALTMNRYKKPAVTAQIERSLLETAQQSDELGMYWANNRQGYFWYESPVETQSLLIELFTEAGNNDKAVDEMKIWLLRNKQTNDWKTTKATAAACYALLLKGNDLLSDTGKSTIKINGKALEELKPDVKADAGTGYIKTSWVDEQIKTRPGQSRDQKQWR